MGSLIEWKGNSRNKFIDGFDAEGMEVWISLKFDRDLMLLKCDESGIEIQLQVSDAMLERC